jgi:hypothetical protein
MTIKELSENVTITCRPGTKLPYSKQDEWQRSANGYSCTLEFQKRRMTVDFWMGTGLQGKPTASDVLSSLVSDSISIENSRSFENWCGDLGFDSHSRKAEKTYRAVLSQSQKLAKFLGPAYEDFLSAEPD